MAHGIELREDVFEQLKEHCLKVYDEKKQLTIDELMMELMDYPEVPMHFPYHHFIIPGVLLTLAALEDGSSRVELEDMLQAALARAKNVLGGFCGNYGACGAGVGAGIFMSIYTDTSPMSEKSWQWANEITGICLQKISTVPGPRCCKRTGFLSMQAAVDYLNEKLGLHLRLNETILCKYADRNPDCKREECPFFPGEPEKKQVVEITAPESAMPKKDPENPCPCQFRPFQLKDKKGEIFWLVSEGERVTKDQVICEGEVEKKTVELLAPCDGTLVKICIGDEETFRAGDILGYIEK